MEEAGATLLNGVPDDGATPSSDQPDTTRRPRAVEYGDYYYTRLAIHRYASYATLPLFAGEFIIGRKLFTEGPSASHGLRQAHSALAAGLGVLLA